MDKFREYLDRCSSVRTYIIEQQKNITELQSSLDSAIEALEKIIEAPGGGPAKRIATLARAKIKGKK